jgi:12,18-didecarboxysiroheme deacetylase
MIGISKLYCGTVEASDPLRYGRDSARLPSDLLQFSKDKKPVVVWNCTKRCNLKCKHCYSASNNQPAPDELTDDEAKVMIDDLAAFGAPVILFSGGEPLMRPGVIDLISYARAAGLRAVVSTNGNLIDKPMAARLAEAGLSYVGVSLDGLKDINDKFRGVDGAFDRALAGIRNCIEAEVKVGLRFTLNKHNLKDVSGIFDLIEAEGIPRVCFYHLVDTGRGKDMSDAILSFEETRDTLDLIMDRTAQAHAAGRTLEVLTVDNHADGPYLYMRLKQTNPERQKDCFELMQMNGGNSSGQGIGCISWDGTVLPDQFWRHQVLGNVRDKPFSEIWTDPDHPLLSKLRDRKSYLQGRCPECCWLSVCNGNFRARADNGGDDIWGNDPACYLTDEEISPKQLD